MSAVWATVKKLDKIPCTWSKKMIPLMGKNLLFVKCNYGYLTHKKYNYNEGGGWAFGGEELIFSKPKTVPVLLDDLCGTLLDVALMCDDKATRDRMVLTMLDSWLLQHLRAKSGK